MRIFLSHAAVDRTIAEHVRNTMVATDAKCDVFVSSKPGQIPADAEWWDVIRKQLRSADGYCVLLTPNSVTRPWVFFEFGAAWMSGRSLVVARAASLSAEHVPSPLSIQQSLSIEVPDEAGEIFRVFGLTLKDAEAFASKAKVLGESALLDALCDDGWSGIEWHGTYYAWQGPVGGLADYKPESEPPGLVAELAHRGLSPSWAREAKLPKHKGEGKQVIYATDRKTWRRPIANGDTFLIVTAPQESAAVVAARFQEQRKKTEKRKQFERSRASISVATEQINGLYDAVERLADVVRDNASDLRLSTRRTQLDLLVQSGHTCFRLAWLQQYSDSIVDSHLVLEEYLGLPELQADDARPSHPGERQSRQVYSLVEDDERGWCWVRVDDEMTILTPTQLAEQVLDSLMTRIQNPLPPDIVQAWYRK